MRPRHCPVRSFPALAFAALATACTLGCAIPTRVAELDLQIPKGATPVAIQAGLDKMDDPKTIRQVQQMLASPEMRDVQKEMVAGLVDGTLATLGDSERGKRIDDITSKAMAGMVRGASNSLRSVDLGKTVSAAMTDEIGPAFEQTMRDDVGPAFKQTMRDDVGPALAEMLKNEDFRRELGATARVLGREMVLGVTEGLAQKKEPAEDGSLLSTVAGLLNQGAKLFGSAAWVLVLVILAMFAWIVKLLAQAKRYRDGAAAQPESAAVIADRPARGSLCSGTSAFTSARCRTATVGHS